MSKSIIGLFVYSIIFSGSAFAVNCQAPQTQMDINQCATNELSVETDKLNATYGRIRAKSTPAQKQQLKAIQLAWIKFKDLSCSFQASGVEGGSIYSSVLSGCLIEITKRRNQELEALANCAEGDVSCPIQ